MVIHVAIVNATIVMSMLMKIINVLGKERKLGTIQKNTYSTILKQPRTQALTK